MQVKPSLRLGIYGSIIAGAAAIPFLSSKSNSEEVTKPTNEQPAKKQEPQIDKRALEESWVTSNYPLIKRNLTKLYRTEEKENKKIKAGELKQEDRQVKIFIANFVPPGKRGDDGGNGPSLHIVKYLDIKQDDGTSLRTYVNEHWPVIENGILAPETLRIRTQKITGSFSEPGAESLFRTDLLQVFWNNDSSYKYGMSPRLFRQRLYSNFDSELGENPKNQVEVPISSPLSCIACHRSQAIFTQDIFKVEKTNFGAIIPDEEFKKPYDNHKGYTEIKEYLEKLLNDKKITQDFFNRITTQLLDSTKYENPGMAEEVSSSSSIPWLEGDVLDKDYDFRAEGFKYKTNTEDKDPTNDKTWLKAGYLRFRDENYAGYWWNRNSNVLIPRY